MAASKKEKENVKEIPLTEFQSEFRDYIFSAHSCIAIETVENTRLIGDIQRLSKFIGMEVFRWSASMGLSCISENTSPEELDPDDILKHLYNFGKETKIREDIIETKENKNKTLEKCKVFILENFCIYLEQDPIIRSWLCSCINLFRECGMIIVLVGPIIRLHPEIESGVTLIDYPLPTEEETRETLVGIQEAASAVPHLDTKISKEDELAIIRNCLGLSNLAISDALSHSLIKYKSLKPETVLEAKIQQIRKTGILEYYATDKYKLDNMGGLDILKSWILKRKDAFTPAARIYGVAEPKGVMLAGVPGCGKSHSAKTIANLLNVPLLRLDIGACLGSLVGESEEKFRRALKTASAMAPNVLWLDEIEKGFAGATSNLDSGVKAGIFGEFIHFMQERKAPVFVVATANNIEGLPPELLRKGRFDELFFIDLPAFEERKEIFKIHLKLTKRNLIKFDLDKLSENAKGFSGSEIEECIKSALYDSFCDNQRELTTEDVICQIKQTIPLVKTMP